LPAPFNSGDPEGGVSLTADGRELYFSIIRTVAGYANSDVYCVRRVDGVWQQPDALGPQVNGDRTWESQPTVSPDGRTLIFASNRKGGQGGIDLWRCHRLKNGDWSRAENLGPAVNTAGNERLPFIHADSKTLYFASNGWQGFGGYDMYFINLTDTYTDLAWGVERVASYLTYETYHAYQEPPYPEDMKVAAWVLRQGEPNEWIYFNQ
jgi:Tol biopolymer transport system component